MQGEDQGAGAADQRSGYDEGAIRCALIVFPPILRLSQVEHDALTSSLRRDLKVAFEERDDLLKKARVLLFADGIWFSLEYCLLGQIRELEEFRSRSEGQLLKLAGLTEQAASLQSSLEDATSLITRLRSEAQASERNHAMRTAMLATCEAQVAQLQKVCVSYLHPRDRRNIFSIRAKEAAEKEDSYAESLLAAKTLRKEMEDLKFNASKREAELQAEIAALLAAEKEKAKAQKLVLDALSAQHERELEAIKREVAALPFCFCHVFGNERICRSI